MANTATRMSDAAYFVLAAFAGALVGLVGTLFHTVSDMLLHRVRAGFLPGLDHLQAIGAAALTSAALVLLAVVLVRRFAPEAAGSGVHEIEGALEEVRPLRWRRILPVKFIGGVLAIGSGLVVGREGPTIHMGAAISMGLSERLTLGKVDQRGLIAAGAAAGLAAAFNAPVAAVLFVIEETRRQFPYTYRTYCGVIFASIASTLVTEGIGGVTPDLVVTIHIPDLELVPAFAVLGVLLGVFGVVFNRALVAALDGFDRLRAVAPYVGPVLVGALIGTLMVMLPEATEGGEDLIRDLVAQTFTPAALLMFVAIRFVTTVLSYSVGAPGGIFAPILTLATLTGLAFASLLGLIVPDSAGHGPAFAVAAMAGLFAASVRAPMVGVVLVCELTGTYELLLPALVTALFATVVAARLGGRPIYETLLERVLKKAGGISSGDSVHRADVVPVELGPGDREQPNRDPRSDRDDG